jgi:NTE family protein
LAQAIIALPSHHFFSIEIDGRLIVRWCYQYYPIDEVKKVRADIIIGVDVQDDLPKGNPLRMLLKS